jgi:hypothetical protein
MTKQVISKKKKICEIYDLKLVKAKLCTSICCFKCLTIRQKDRQIYVDSITIRS